MEKKKKFMKGDDAKKLLALESKEPKRRTVKEQREAMYGKEGKK